MIGKLITALSEWLAMNQQQVAMAHSTPDSKEGGFHSASVAVARVGIPVQANRIYGRARSPTNETEDSVGMQGNSVETCA